MVERHRASRVVDVMKMPSRRFVVAQAAVASGFMV
jgi:hypothetical protein